MSSLVNKVKSALGGDNSGADDYSDTNKHGRGGFDSKLSGSEDPNKYLDSERRGARHGSENLPGSFPGSGQDNDYDGSNTGHGLGSSKTGHGYNTAGTGRGYDNDTSGHGQSQGLTSTGRDYDNDTTGRGQSQGLTSGKHSDGRDYVPPTGSAVGSNNTTSHTIGGQDQSYGTTNQPSSGGQSAFDRAEQDVTGRDSQYGKPGHNYSSSGAGMHDNSLMDPASKSHGSNVMGTTGTTDTGGHGHHQNKLHKKDDPRGYESNLTEDQGKHHHNKHHHHDKGVDNLSSGQTQSEYSGNTSGIGGTPYEHQNTDHSRSGTGAATAAAAAAGTGGLARKEVPERRHHHDQSGYGNEQTQGRTGGDYSGSGTTGDRYGQQGLGQTGQDARVYNGVTGHGSGEDLLRGSGTGRSNYDTSSRQPGRNSEFDNMPSSMRGSQSAGLPDRSSGMNTGSTGSTGMNTGSIGMDASNSGMLNTGKTGMDPVSAGMNTGSSGLNTGSSGMNTGSSGMNTGSSGMNTGSSGMNTGSSGMNTGGSGTNTGSSGMNTGGSGMNTDRSGNQGMYDSQSSMGNSSGAGMGSQYGQGSGQNSGFTHQPKYLHQCTKCGHDNDISHHFKQGATYRIEQ